MLSEPNSQGAVRSTTIFIKSDMRICFSEQYKPKKCRDYHVVNFIFYLGIKKARLCFNFKTRTSTCFMNHWVHRINTRAAAFSLLSLLKGNISLIYTLVQINVLTIQLKPKSTKSNDDQNMNVAYFDQ